MQISLSFNPAEDKREHVASVVDAVYGVKSFPNDHSADRLAPSTPALPAQTSSPALNVDVGVTAPQLPNAAPVAIADFPNAMTAPTQPVTQAATHSPAGVELDKHGIPWDVRIHSGGLDTDGSHKKNKDGSWAKRKGVSDLDVSNITKELQNLMSATIGTGTPPAGLPVGGVLGNPVNVPHQVAVALPTDPNAYVVAASAGTASLVNPVPTQPVDPSVAATLQTAPTLTPNIAPMPTLAPNIAPMPVPMPAVQTPTDFTSLAIWMAPQMEEAGGKLSAAHVEHFCRQCNIVNGQGVGDFTLVANRPDAVAWLHQAFVAQIAAAQ